VAGVDADAGGLVASAIKNGGVLLITSALIIPAAARRSTATPGGIAATAIGVGLVSTAAGSATAHQRCLPSGPARVATIVGLFAPPRATGARVARG
jgi:ABC-type Mn2+/Zn2+ transport system permease subunit